MEFPDIRVDFFRPVKDMQPPLACFLSHVHSDHLNSLESLKSPFIYCSAATKEILLRLERKDHRLNFANGVLEARKLTYRHLKNLLKPIPLETPTRIELSLGKKIQVTLFDANHCTGAVMFLFESEDKAVLYTGDIRSEPWFVNNLRRNPFLIEYTSGMKGLDCIYLDTSNLDPMTFPSKADGLKELLQKVAQYPDDTIFHFSAWTFGYEEVWMVLSRALKSSVHVDKYKLGLYQALCGDSSVDPSGLFPVHEGPVLTGYQCGNTPQGGYLTTDPAARIHSCEKGMNCPAINNKTVWIKPIITRLKNGSEITEIGIGRGWGDLAQQPELRFGSELVVDQPHKLFGGLSDPLVTQMKTAFLEKLRKFGGVVALEDMGVEIEDDKIPLEDLMESIIDNTTRKRGHDGEKKDIESEYGCLPNTITFPYSRHSSYLELVDLVRLFRPKDVYPCTVDEYSWHEGISIQRLFGEECSTIAFRHDREMEELLLQREEVTQAHSLTQATESHLSTQHPLTRSPVQQPIIMARPVKKVTIRRNSQGSLRAFDVEGNEVLLGPQLVCIISDQNPESTPTNETHIISPNPESQGLRRKAIADGFSQGPVKRARLALGNSFPSVSPETAPTPSKACEYIASGGKKALGHSLGTRELPSTVFKVEPVLDSRLGESSEFSKLAFSTTKIKRPSIINLTSVSSSFTQSPRSPRNTTHRRLDSQNNPSVEAMLAVVRDRFSGHSPRANTLGSEDASEQLHLALPQSNFSPWVNDRGEEVNYLETEIWYPHGGSHAESYSDLIDEVERCFFCGHERWSRPHGFCTNCPNGQSGTPYFEVLDPEAGARPLYEINDDVFESNFNLEDHLRDTLDCHSSAYDSQDDDYVIEEYEKNSFIDDSSQHVLNEEEEVSSIDGEIDYKEKYRNLQEAYTALQRRHEHTTDAFEELCRHIMYSNYESQSLSCFDDETEDVTENDEDINGEFDKDGALMVNRPISDSVIMDLVVDSTQEQSQYSEMSQLTPERMKKRAEAFEAAEKSEWHTITLASTTKTEEINYEVSIEL